MDLSGKCYLKYHVAVDTVADESLCPCTLVGFSFQRGKA